MGLVTDAAAIQNILLTWSEAGKLQEAVISSDGGTISLGTPDESDPVTIDAKVKLSVVTESRSCEYSAAAIFLQIRNPAQSLVAYRNDCKLYNVADIIKALDKAAVVSFFVKNYSLETAQQQHQPTAGTAATAAAPQSDLVTPGKDGDALGESSKERHKESKTREGETAEERQKRKEREKRHRESSSKHKSKSSDHHHRHKSALSGAPSSSHRHGEEPSHKKKKKPDMVTNEQLFEHLNVVVDKRANNTTDVLADAIAAALSAKGFEITGKEQLEPYLQRTADIVANEIPVGNSASILRANNPRKDLTRVLELYMETVNPTKDGKLAESSKAHSSKHASSSAKQASSGNRSNFKHYLLGKKPVIIVPKGMTSPITLVNAHEFLSNARFVPRDAMVKQQQQKGLRAPPTTFTRSIQTSSNSPSTGLLEYEIIDNPRKLGSDHREWERIVAVIVLGQSWQFKDWLKTPVAYNVPATLFDKVYGFFVSMEGDKLPPDVTNWAVHRAQINRDKRGLDSVMYASFWNGLDEWMKVYKAELLPQAES
jgi:RNA pol II accessory factor, Cdc73 family, C-terminal